jgi:phosphoglycolate phosphatase-like HAD superfamily hydrolase
MAVNPIRAVVFDLGGTLEDLYYDDTIHQAATLGMQKLLAERGLDPGLDPTDLQATVLSGMRAYQAWREESEIELPLERVWAEYIFADHGLVIQVRSFLSDKADHGTGSVAPDAMIDDLMQVVSLVSPNAEESYGG